MHLARLNAALHTCGWTCDGVTVDGRRWQMSVGLRRKIDESRVLFAASQTDASLEYRVGERVLGRSTYKSLRQALLALTGYVADHPAADHAPGDASALLAALTGLLNEAVLTHQTHHTGSTAVVDR